MAKKILSVSGYFLLYLVSTLLFVYFTFPLDRLQAFIIFKANSSNKYRLEMDGIEREGMGALVLDGVRLGIHRKLLKRGARPGAGNPGQTLPEALKAAKGDDIVEDGGSVGASEGKRSNAKVQKKTAVPQSVGKGKLNEKGGGSSESDGEKEESESDKVERGLAGAIASDYSFIEIDTIRISFDMFDFLTPGQFKLGVDAELLNGSIEGGELEFFEEHGMSRPAIRFPEIYALQLGDAEFFGVVFSALLPSVKTDRVEGTLDRGLVELEPQLEEEQKSYSGRIELEFSGIVALAPMLVNQLRNAPLIEVPLTDMRLGKCIFHVKVDRQDQIPGLGKVTASDKGATAVFFEKGECKGESLDYFIKPNSYILLPEKGSIMKGKMDLWTKLAFSPDYFDEKRLEDGVVTTRNQELGKGLEFDRMWQEAQDTQGYYWMHCQGSLSQPRCRRELPKEEKSKKDALKEVERKRKAGKATETGVRGGSGSALPVREGTATKRESLLEQRREAARKRMEAGKESGVEAATSGGDEGAGVADEATGGYGAGRKGSLNGGRPPVEPTPTFGGSGGEEVPGTGEVPADPTAEELPQDPVQEEPPAEEGALVPEGSGVEGSGVEGTIPEGQPTEPGTEGVAPEGEGAAGVVPEGVPEGEIPANP